MFFILNQTIIDFKQVCFIDNVINICIITKESNDKIIFFTFDPTTLVTSTFLSSDALERDLVNCIISFLSIIGYVIVVFALDLSNVMVTTSKLFCHF